LADSAGTPSSDNNHKHHMRGFQSLHIQTG